MQDNTSRNERGPTEVEGFLLSASNASAGILCVFQTSVAKQSAKSTDIWRDRTSDGLCKQRSSEKERKGNALASGAEEGRDKLRKASGSCK